MENKFINNLIISIKNNNISEEEFKFLYDKFYMRPIKPLRGPQVEYISYYNEFKLFKNLNIFDEGVYFTLENKKDFDLLNLIKEEISLKEKKQINYLIEDKNKESSTGKRRL